MSLLLYLHSLPASSAPPLGFGKTLVHELHPGNLHCFLYLVNRWPLSGASTRLLPLDQRVQLLALPRFLHGFNGGTSLNAIPVQLRRFSTTSALASASVFVNVLLLWDLCVLGRLIHLCLVVACIVL